MSPYFIFLALIIQSSIAFAHQDEDVISRDVLKNNIDLNDEVVKDFHEAKKDWIDIFVLPPNGGLHPTSSVAMMEEVTKASNKSLEDQLEDIKEMANKITMCIQKEMADLLSYALSCEKENSTRMKRSLESPMDSTKLVMRLLKHIKANNEYQNIAIENMMTAQEIADKYGVEFSPDTEVLSDLAVAANNQAQELTDILKDACDGKNVTKEHVTFVPIDKKNSKENVSYYSYGVEHEAPKPKKHDHNPFAPYEYVPEQLHKPVNHVYHPEPTYYHNYHPSTPISVPVYSPPVTQRPNYYDSMMAYTPAQETYYPYCSFEPVTTTTTIVFPIEEPVELEPELTGEEYEETVSSKVVVDHESEPGAATVNHIMTYTLSEKAHFKTPEIEKLPQQMQYTFFLM